MKKITWFFLLLLLGLILSIILTWPLLININRYYSKITDHFIFDWLFQYNYQSIISGNILNIQTFYNTNLYYPLSNLLATADFTILPSLILYTPFKLITQDSTVSLNLVIFFSFVLNFLSSFLVLNKLLKSKVGALAGAMYYTFSTAAYNRFFNSHIEHMQRYFIPPLFYMAILFFEKPTKKTSLLLFLFFVLSWLTNLQLTIFSMVLIFFIFIFFCFHNFSKKTLTKWLIQILTTSFLFSLLTLLLIVIFYWPYINLYYADNFYRPLSNLHSYSIKIKHFFLVNQSALLSNFYQHIGLIINKNNANGAANFPGIVSYIFILIFAFSRSIKKDLIKKLFIVITIVSIVVAFGPILLIDKYEVRLPYYYLYQWFFLLRSIRTPERIMLAVIFFIGGLIGWGAKKLYSKKRILTYILLILMMFEFKHVVNIDAYKKNYPKFNLDGKKVLIYPIMNKNNADVRYLPMSTAKKLVMVNGNLGSNPTAFYYLANDVNRSIDKDRGVLILNTLDLDYLIVDKFLGYSFYTGIYQSKINQIRKIFSQVVYEDNQYIIFDLKQQKDNQCYSSDVDDLDITIQNIGYKDNQLIADLLIKNPNTCHKRFFYNLRYVSLEHEVNDDDKILESKKTIFGLRPYILSGDAYVKDIIISSTHYDQGTIKIKIGNKKLVTSF